MARARKRARSAEPTEAVDQEPENGSSRPLESNKPLTWKPGKAVPVTDLLRRLKQLSEELASIEQEDADRETLVPKAQELASPLLIAHKDKGVKAWTMMCIVEMFRLLAPEAPFKPSQLRDIFSLFTSSIVPALASTTDPYNQQHTYVLTSLTTIKSIVLITDIPGSDNLILSLFTNCFDVLSGDSRGDSERLPKNLEYHMTSMLCTLVDECVALPGGVVEIILAQFLRADPNAMVFNSKKGDAKPSQVLLEPSPAYNMARSVCNTCADKMSRAVGQYFSSVLIDASETFSTTKAHKPRGKKRTHDESEDDSDDGGGVVPTTDDLIEVEKAHRLLRELWRSSPDVIRPVVPQIEAEMGGEDPHLRTIAVQAIGDMVAGIGAVGLAPAIPMDPAAYPSQSLEATPEITRSQNFLLVPAAPLAFSSVYHSAYQAFIDRRRDKAAIVRSAWASAGGRILLTSGGGKGLDSDQEDSLLRYLSDMLLDHDEKVRLSAIQVISDFNLQAIIHKLGKNGGVAVSGSILCNLTGRIKDTKHPVRTAAMELLGRLWGVAAGAITEGSQHMRELLGTIPSKILEATYVNDNVINALIQRVLHESLLPVYYPPVKSKHPSNGDSQRVVDSQNEVDKSADPDTVRTERILTFVRDLDERAKKVWVALLARRPGTQKYLESYLQTSEQVHGSDSNDKEAKKKLAKIIEVLAQFTADPATASEHLQKFSKHHDRRSYQLIRFCYSPESDYRKIVKAMKELIKRTEEAPSGKSAVLETVVPLVRMASILVYNKSHVPAIVEISRTDEKGLGSAAHEVLKEISARAPEIFKIHVHELCETLKKQDPASGTAADSAIQDTLKACAGFARRFPNGMPKDRDFYKSMAAFAIHGKSPKAAKHAITVIVSSAENKEMHIRDIVKTCIQKFKYAEEGFLPKLAAISQLRLLAFGQCEDQADDILEIAINQVLTQTRTTAQPDDPLWSNDVDDDLAAKLWALRVLVNGLRGYKPVEDGIDERKKVQDLADPVYKLLNTLIRDDGELSSSSDTPSSHKAHLRLASAIHLLKLSRNRNLDVLLSQADFNALSKITQDPLPEVRAGFVTALEKHLGARSLPNRFYAMMFLYAFEPNKETKESTIAWIRSRAALSAKTKDTVMEAAFARFMALLAHHQDFSTNADELEDFVEYIMFYIKTVATQENLPTIYHLAQRLKQVQDGLNPQSENLYILADIAEAVIRQYQEVQGWSLQVISGKAGLPSGLFQRIPTHERALEIADRKYIPDELAENLEDLVRKSLKVKKRKSDSSSTQAAKKAKHTLNAPAKRASVSKTPKRPSKDAVTSAERRKSGRTSKSQNYAENDDSEDDEELEQWQADEAEDEVVDDGEANKENLGSATPPTSDPVPVPPSTDTGKKRIIEASKTATKSGRATRAMPARGRKARKEKDIYDMESGNEMDA